MAEQADGVAQAVKCSANTGSVCRQCHGAFDLGVLCINNSDLSFGSCAPVFNFCSSRNLKLNYFFIVPLRLDLPHI